MGEQPQGPEFSNPFPQTSESIKHILQMDYLKQPRTLAELTEKKGFLITLRDLMDNKNN